MPGLVQSRRRQGGHNEGLSQRTGRALVQIIQRLPPAGLRFSCQAELGEEVAQWQEVA